MAGQQSEKLSDCRSLAGMLSERCWQVKIGFLVPQTATSDEWLRRKTKSPGNLLDGESCLTNTTGDVS